MISTNSTPHSFQPGSPSFPLVEGAFDQSLLYSFDQTETDNHILLSTNYQFSKTVPSHSQQEAIHVLQCFDNHVVITSLAIIRSFQSGRFHPGSLAKQHIRAFLQLKDCPDDLVLEWLNSYRSTGTFNGLPNPNTSNNFGTQRITSWSASEALPKSSSSSTARSSTISAWPPSPFDNLTGPSTPRTSRGQTSSHIESLSGISFDDRSTTSLASTKHPHGCPRCKKPRAIETCNGWKRHMKEHETVWPCTLCLDLDTPGKAKSYSRKINLVGHLETSHGFSNDEGSDLAETWKKTLPKKYFGCGFCISLFTSIQDQLNHIDNEHFKNMHSIGEWKINKVIRGLLMQPDVFLIWQNGFQSSYLASEELAWDLSVAKDLQLLLELSSAKAGDLAEMAITSANWCGNPQRSSGLNYEPVSPYEQVQKVSSFPEHEDVSTQPALHTCPTLASSTGMASDLNLPAQGHQMAWDTSDQSSLESSQAQPTIPDSEINLYGNTSIGYRHIATGRTSVLQPAEDCGGLLQQAQNPATWTGTVITDFGSRSGHDQNRDPMPATPFSVPSNSTLRSSPALSPYHHSPLTNTAHRAENTEGVSSTINSRGVSLAQVQGRYTIPELAPSAARLNKQRSRKKLRDHYGAPDLDIDELQDLMRDEDRTRSVRRHG